MEIKKEHKQIPRTVLAKQGGGWWYWAFGGIAFEREKRKVLQEAGPPCLVLRGS